MFTSFKELEEYVLGCGMKKRIVGRGTAQLRIVVLRTKLAEA